MELKEIRKSISEMTDEELRAELTAIRANRRVSKRPPTPAKKTVLAAEAPPNTTSLIASLTPEQAAELLKKLGG